MKSLKKLAAMAMAAAVSLALSSPALATNGYFTHGVGTQSKGMAGTGVGSNADMGAIMTASNPALGVFASDSWEFGLAVFSPRRSYAPSSSQLNGSLIDLGGGVFLPSFTMSQGKIESSSEYFPIPWVAKNWSLANDANISAVFYGRGGMNTDWDDTNASATSYFCGGDPALRVAALWTKRDRGLLRMAGQEVPWHREHRGVALDLPVDCGALAIESFAVDAPAEAGGEPRVGLAVAFWNPHAVFTVEESELDAFPLAEFAAAVRADTGRFPDGVNVSLVAPVGLDRVRARVDERGVGETAACGSAAVAIAATVWRGDGPARVEVLMSGGELDLERLPGARTGLRGAARTGPPKGLEELLG